MAEAKMMLPDGASGGRLPVPDPTELTDKAISKLREELLGQIHALKELEETRITGLTDEVKRVRDLIDARPAAIVQEIGHLKQLMLEMFKGVADQFAGRDTALAAALLAQKTSVEEQNKSNALATSKSEAAFTKQIDAVAILINNNAAAMDDKLDSVKTLVGSLQKSSDEKIADLRDRLTAMDGRSTGGKDTWAYIIAGLGAIAILVGLYSAISARPDTKPVVIEQKADGTLIPR